jgi:hypothetical protein
MPLVYRMNFQVDTPARTPSCLSRCKIKFDCGSLKKTASSLEKVPHFTRSRNNDSLLVLDRLLVHWLRISSGLRIGLEVRKRTRHRLMGKCP